MIAIIKWYLKTINSNSLLTIGQHSVHIAKSENL